MSQYRLALFLSLVASLPVFGQSDEQVKRLALHPAGEPSPAFKYELLPGVFEQGPGNAVLSYYRAFSPDWYTWRSRPGVYQKIEDAFQKAPRDLAKTDLDWVKTSNQLRELDLGARSAYCDWQLMERIRTDGISLLLPDMQSFRELSRMLALRARLEIAGRDHEKAIYSLQTGLKQARDIASAPLLICVLVGVACAETQLDQVETLMQAPRSPNLYWALAGLPHPFIDLHSAIQGEKLFSLAEIPLLKDIETKQMTVEEATALARQFQQFVRRSEGSHAGISSSESFLLLMLAAQAYPDAKKRLLEGGWKAEAIEKLPALQVVAIDANRIFLQVRDDAAKWLTLPYPQAIQGLRKNQDRIRIIGNENMIARPLLGMIGPSTRLLTQVWQTERHIAALRVIEAVRLHAAANHSHLPATLGDIHLVPVPDDPITGKAFSYKVSGAHFTLSGAAPEGESPTWTISYEVTMLP